MAYKIITNDNGEVITKTSKKVRTERRIRKFQKVATVGLMLAFFSLTVFADDEVPEGVNTTSMNTLSNIVWWVVRIAVAAIVGIPGIIKTAQGISNEDNRERNMGLAQILIGGALIGATFAIKAAVGI
jgi:hypothetical protein